MARTVHHVPWRRRDAEAHEHHDLRDCHDHVHDRVGIYAWDCNYAGPDHVIADLRYSAAVLAAADAAGARPVPVAHTATVGIVTGPRAVVNTETLGEECRQAERAARARLRDDLVAARATANAALVRGAWDTEPDEPGWVEDLDSIEVRPVRHRNNALWNQW